MMILLLNVTLVTSSTVLNSNISFPKELLNQSRKEDVRKSGW
jgi:hypothetical protein